MRKRRLSANVPSIEALLRSKATPPDCCRRHTFAVCLLREREPNPAHPRAKTLAQKAIALLMALVLCMGLTPHAAWAEETGETGGSSAPQAVEQPTVTLTIVNGFGYFGPNVLVNKAYSFTEGQTLADLFAAAKGAGDIKDYEFSNPYGYGEYLASVTMPDDTVVSDPTGAASYWANFKNGSYASGAACQAGDKLAAGDAFQFAFTDLVVNRAPFADEWAVLKGRAEGVAPSKPGQSGSTNQGKPSTANSNKYDAAKAETLIANLSARFAINGKDHAIDNNTFYAAIALNSLGKGASIDAAAILANLNKDDLMTAGRMGKCIMALTAAGIDCTKVHDNGTVRNLVAEKEALEKPESMSVYDTVCILPVYQYGSYKQGDSAMAPSALIDLILANVDDEGLFGSAQPDEQVAQQQAQEQSASASSTSVKQSTSGQPDNSQDGGDKASSAEDGKAKDENSLTDSSQEQSEGSSSEQASQSGASSGGSGASGSAASNASENSGSASSSGSAPAYQEPEPEPAPAPAPSTISVHISIDSSRAQSYGLGGFSYGSTVYDALCATGASVSGSSYYVSAINGLAEKQCGDGSGWTYAVNGSFPGKACGRYALSGGESISWIYSTEKNPTMAM